MARPTRDHGLMPSMLDRLTDPAMLGSGMLTDYSAARMMDSIRRDLEDLFNTHIALPPEALDFEAVRTSILAYGLPDFPSISAKAGFKRDEVSRLIEEAVARHEPRLRDVRVVTNEADKDSPSHRIRLRIEARLNVDPSPEVEFETILELTTGQASIKDGQA